jgi:hypothetical protein
MTACHRISFSAKNRCARAASTQVVMKLDPPKKFFAIDGAKRLE